MAAVAGKLSVFDCAGVADGAAAVIVVPAEKAYEYTDKPLFVKPYPLFPEMDQGS